MADEATRLQSQLAVLLDKQAVYEVLLGIARGVDRYDPELLSACIHEDALLDMGGETAIAGGTFAAAMKPPAAPPIGRMHLVANPVISVSGDEASCESYIVSCQELSQGEGSETRLRAGRYLDRFERRDGIWKLIHRTMVDEWARTDAVKQAPIKGRHRGRPAPEDLAYRTELA